MPTAFDKFGANLKACGWAVGSANIATLDAIRQIAISQHPGAALISTCQRIEVFHTADCCCPAPGRWEGEAALVRLAELAAGLHSAVLGEEQVLGQVRGGLANADENVKRIGATAIAAARRLRSEAQFESHTGHLLDAGLELAGVAACGRIAVLGAGVVGRLVVARALALGFEDVVVFGRARPDALTNDPRVQFRLLSTLSDSEPVDVLAACLGSAAGQVSPQKLPPVRGLIIDLGTPRNVLDDPRLKIVAISDLMARQPSPPEIEQVIALRSRLHAILAGRLEAEGTDSTTHVGRMRQEVERIRRQEVARIQRLHPEIPPATVEAITSSLVNQIFHRPSGRLRALDDPALGEMVVALFSAEADQPAEVCP